ncbi:hypothetical protein COT98_03325 [Candidatus Falkowbacteria bacterium CG10_big_fil_rev_8_21_14_0_10_39_9]|uniref:Methyltransferase type 11 domain-containing protein n=1 Tax=Candidatus Falkowbacteria bacterium CG10_big_fil_rev_8_21_14_0_10_39_9 TaxID=1974566 RepID=A0A2M6WNZ1_9BACT|nr:MAG: hypothetical protein COT98_03325 [Candidatus Falkowbacteria bacterium CG10_big_fil_rev_8_21_14_0_10_39_9]
MDYRDFQRLNSKKNEHFWYKARRLLVTNLLQSTLKNKNEERQIIELGCGTGVQLPLLSQYGTVTGLDIVPESIAIIKMAGLSGRVFDIENESLKNNSAEVVACFDVLEHLEHDEAALKKIARALKTQGVFLFSVPAAPWLFGPHDQAASHFRRYSKKEIKRKINNSGLELKTINYWNAWLFPIIVPLRLIKRVISSRANSDTKPLPSFLNNILYQILAAETKLGLKLPWGLSLYGTAYKK